MTNKKIKGEQCNKCKIFYPLKETPNFCLCGNNMHNNSTKNTFIVFEDVLCEDKDE